MNDPRYERYREALRQGHLAALRGDHQAAVAAYRGAAHLAPDRPLAYTGQGTGLRELGRLEDALDAFGRALELAPLDEAALRGRAGALIAVERVAEAAATLTDLAEALDADDRSSEALEVARHAQLLAGSPARVRLVDRLTGRIAAAAGIAPGEPASAPGEASATAGVTEAGEADGLDGTALVAEGDALADAGRLTEAKERYLLGARAHRAAGSQLAALDACHIALAIAPADPALHLILAELYQERGWLGLATDKLLLLVRLLDLAGDVPARERLCHLVTARFADEPRLVALCA